MRLKYLFICCLGMLLAASCSENTSNLGGSLIDDTDKLTINSDSFEVSTKSVLSGAVLSRDANNHLGKVLDAETGTYITSNFMTQFYCPNDFSLPKTDSIVSKDASGVYADSCRITLYYDSFYGDSLTKRKFTAFIMDQPMLENREYKSDFNPEVSPYITSNSTKYEKVYSLVDMNIPATVRSKKTYYKGITIDLNSKYYDKNNVEYKNFGTYLMKQYYSNPSYFANPLQFIKNVLPGIYFKSTSGVGAMANISAVDISVFFRLKKNGQDTKGGVSFSGTEEVLSTTYVQNDQTKLNSLVNETQHTYLKTPAGIYTQMELPIEKIMQGHDNDTISSAKIILHRINNTTASQYAFNVPTTVMLIPVDEAATFFSQRKLADNKTSYLAEYSKTYNTYTFNNISKLVHTMYKAKKNGTASANWNKVLLIPVKATYTSDASSGLTILSSVEPDMSLTSTKLVGGPNNTNGKVLINVIYSKFNR